MSNELGGATLLKEAPDAEYEEPPVLFHDRSVEDEGGEAALDGEGAGEFQERLSGLELGGVEGEVDPNGLEAPSPYYSTHTTKNKPMWQKKSCQKS